jgi:hypothetical protein
MCKQNQSTFLKMFEQFNIRLAGSSSRSLSMGYATKQPFANTTGPLTRRFCLLDVFILCFYRRLPPPPKFDAIAGVGGCLTTRRVGVALEFPICKEIRRKVEDVRLLRAQ